MNDDYRYFLHRARAGKGGYRWSRQWPNLASLVDHARDVDGPGVPVVELWWHQVGRDDMAYESQVWKLDEFCFHLERVITGRDGEPHLGWVRRPSFEVVPPDREVGLRGGWLFPRWSCEIAE